MEQPKFIYVFDTLCTWCYGFSPIVASVKKKYESQCSFEIISGGLILEERVGPLHKIASLGFHNLLQQISEASGVTFGNAFLKQFEEGNYIYNSKIPATALVICKQDLPEKSFAFAHAMQKAVYEEGKDLTSNRFYYDLALDFGLDPDNFIRKMQDEQYQNYVIDDFAAAKQLKATSFPRLFIQTGDTYFYLVAEGFTNFSTLDQRIQNILEEIGQ